MDGVGYLYTGETSGLDRPIDAKYHAGSWLDDIPFDPAAPSLLEIAEALAREVPDEEWAKVPTDLAANVDHYLYGTPKREPGPPPTGDDSPWDAAVDATGDTVRVRVSGAAKPSDHAPPALSAATDIMAILSAEVRPEHPILARDIDARAALGLKRYGTPLRPSDGLDSRRELYEEVLDGMGYARKYRMEGNDDLRGVERRLLEIAVEMSERRLPDRAYASAHEVAGRVFDVLAARWRRDTAATSSLSEIVEHPAYQAIIAMGVLALPWVLDDMEREPTLWGPALQAITGADPVLPEHAGNVRETAADWVRWGRESGILGPTR